MAIRRVGYDASGNLLDYATIADAFLAASSGDTLTLWYSDANRNPKWLATSILGGGMTTKGVSLAGALPGQRTTILCSNIASFYTWTPASGTVAIAIQNLTFRMTNNPSSSTICLKFDGTAAGNSATVDSCRFIGGFVFALQAYASFAQTVKNCFFSGVGRPVLGDGDSLVYLHHDTLIDCPLGVNLQYAGEIKNCVFVNSGATQSMGASVVASHNVSTGTAPGTNGLSNVKYDELRLWETDLGGYGLLAPQVFPDSVLASGGTAIAGISADIDGLAYAVGVTPRGCSRGRDILPTQAHVLSTETYNGSATLTGQFVNLSPTLAVFGEQWGAGGTEFTGEYVGGVAPAAPLFTSATPTDGTVNFSLTAGGTADTLVLYSRPASHASGWAYAGSRTGSGTVNIGGLTNGQPVEYVSYAISGGLNSAPSNTITRIASGTTADMELIMAAVADAITSAGLSSYDGTAIAAEVRMPPIADHHENIACIVCESAEELTPDMTSINTGTYRIAVRIFERLGSNAANDTATISRERALIQSIRRMFPGRRLSALPDVYCMGETGNETIPPDALRDENVIATELTFEFRKRHTRGA